jgi:hypothetical protein
MEIVLIAGLWLDGSAWDAVVPRLRALGQLSKARSIDYVDIESGHWPMYTRPAELADLLSGIAHA